ncbi:hypothetical protein [Jeotgalibacillus campisalis]|uniref:Uncharacterized protein n=1 Tax=Jeotgalibacillus campisalis TaxID=220754 RepID=A0A0C2RN40_9BACL|nr:hypothetical protein [Jeotgalibacillus campisalis]KIL43189.1 hypothetical protein KR50_35920 [Jeotgalibacillus campisalis]
MAVRRQDLYKLIDNISEENLEKVKEILETLSKYEEEFDKVEPTDDQKMDIEEANSGEFHSFEDVFKYK